MQVQKKYLTQLPISVFVAVSLSLANKSHRDISSLTYYLFDCTVKVNISLYISK